MISRIPGSVPTRSRAVVHDGLVEAVATSPIKSASVYEQAREALAQLDETLMLAGAAKSDLLSVQVYLADISRKAELNRAWDEWVDLSAPPVRACLGVALEGADLVELVATASLQPKPISGGGGP